MNLVVPKVTLGGVNLAAKAPIAWRFQTGVRPFSTVFQVHSKDWPRLQSRMGEPLVLSITDSRGTVKEIQGVYILNEVASDSPARVSFIVADVRWKWAYRLITKDYNVSKKSGDRSIEQAVPVENLVTVDLYDFKPYSLKDGEKWTPRTALEDVLGILEDETELEWRIDSLPLDGPGEVSTPQFTLQNFTLRDPADSALARLLAYIPGAEIWIDDTGAARVFDAADLDESRAVLEGAGTPTYDGDKVIEIDKRATRPSIVNVYVTREVEVAFEFEDDYSGGTRSAPVQNAPYLENVLPTVDLETEVTEYDPESGEDKKKTLPPGVWVEVSTWLRAMDDKKPKGSAPWTWDNLKRHWITGDLDGMLGGRDLDLEENALVSMRVQALKQHFRQTFRMSPRYANRVRDIRPVRAALLDPVSGQRAPAGVFGQGCVVPSEKGRMIFGRQGGSGSLLYRNVDYTPRVGKSINETPPAPARVDIIDKDLGVFRISWINSPFGLTASIIPCNTEAPTGGLAVASADLQNPSETYYPGTRTESSSGSLFLADKMRLVVVMTVVPAAPNNLQQFHREQVRAEDIAEEYRAAFGIEGGRGPELDVFVGPGELTARFGWVDTPTATGTIGALLGLNNPDPAAAGIPPGAELEGYAPANAEREVPNYCLAVAAQAIAGFADAIQGVSSSIMQDVPIRLAGNNSSYTIRIAGGDSRKITAQTEFTGQQKQISRFALLPEAVRRSVLGVVAFPE